MLNSVREGLLANNSAPSINAVRGGPRCCAKGPKNQDGIARVPFVRSVLSLCRLDSVGRQRLINDRYGVLRSDHSSECGKDNEKASKKPPIRNQRNAIL